MKIYSLLTLLSLSSLSSTAFSEEAAILIDFGSAAGKATDKYNVIHGKRRSGQASIQYLQPSHPLINSAGKSSGTLLITSNTTSGWGDTLAEANWTGAKPSELAHIQQAATSDGLFISCNPALKAHINLNFSGLLPDQDYTVLFYSARQQTDPAPTEMLVTTGIGSGATITNCTENTTEIGSCTVTTTTFGELTLQFSTETKRGATAAALNFLSLTPVAEQPFSALMHFRGTTLTLSNPQKDSD